MNLTALALVVLAAETPQAPATESHRILALPEGREIGTRRLRKTVDEKEKTLEVVEELEMDHRGKKISYRTTVRYRLDPSPAPLGASARTAVEGKPCMEGSVEFPAGMYAVAMTGLADKEGVPFPEPRKHERREKPLPRGTVLFQSVLSSVGPRLLPAAGEKKEIVFAEFPDDLAAPELLNLKERHRLVREDGKESGFTLRLFGVNAIQPLAVLEFDAAGRCLSETVGKMKFVPAGTER